MRCKNCPHDLGYKAGMLWPPYKPTCKLGKKPMFTNNGDLYNRKCKDKKEAGNEG